jgi:hypothetical protein
MSRCDAHLVKKPRVPQGRDCPIQVAHPTLERIEPLRVAY